MLEETDVDAYVVWLGYNDATRPLHILHPDLSDEYRNIIDDIKSSSGYNSNTRILCLTPFNNVVNSGYISMANVSTWIQTVAQETGCHVVNIFDSAPYSASYLASDNIHLNTDGENYTAHLVYNELSTLGVL